MGSYLSEYWSDHIQIFNKYKRHVSNKIAIYFILNKIKS